VVQPDDIKDFLEVIVDDLLQREEEKRQHALNLKLQQENVDMLFGMAIQNEEKKEIDIENIKKHYEEKQKKQREENKCIICCDNPKNTVCIPCGHISTCATCNGNVNFRQLCPICRQAGNFHIIYNV
jgi:hypothetical protein